MTTPQPSDTPRVDQWADLRALEAAATPGPWEADVDGVWVGAAPEDPLDGAPSIDISTLRHEDDAAFIAAARNAVPDLLVEVDRLRAALVEAQQEAESGKKVIGGLITERDAAEEGRKAAHRRATERRSRIKELEGDLKRAREISERREARAEQAERRARELPEQIARAIEAQASPTLIDGERAGLLRAAYLARHGCDCGQAPKHWHHIETGPWSALSGVSGPTTEAGE